VVIKSFARIKSSVSNNADPIMVELMALGDPRVGLGGIMTLGQRVHLWYACHLA
jgi:hypothetical protein